MLVKVKLIHSFIKVGTLGGEEGKWPESGQARITALNVTCNRHNQ